MHIRMVTPASRGSLHGNRVTALRWALLMRQLGHHVAVGESFAGEPCDVLVALHARRSAPAVERFAGERPGWPIVVVLTGTDLYQDLPDSREAQRSLALATRLVVLTPQGLAALPEAVRSKARAIVQSASCPASPHPFASDSFDVCVVGHLREVKDPFLAARAARLLSASSRLRVLHIGAVLTPAFAAEARAEMADNPRYQWLGELPRLETLRRLAASRLLVVSSRLEGGANVVSEALACGVSIVSSRIDGSVGLLGEDYPGYFPVGDTGALAALLDRVERDPCFREQLARCCAALRPLVDPVRERGAWSRLLLELVPADVRSSGGCTVAANQSGPPRG